MLLIESRTFKGKLSDLIGRSKAELLAAYAQPSWQYESSNVERLLWADQAVDDATGETHRIYYVARLINERVWAVGILSEAFFFPIQPNPTGEPYFVSVPKQQTSLAINWVVKRDGRLENLGVST